MDGETKDTSLQLTDPMDTSTGSLLGKRGIEAISTGVDEEEKVEDEEEKIEDEDKASEDSNWDKDSFEGMVYDSAEDHERYSDEEFTKVARDYNRMVIETKGFFEITKNSTPFYMWTGICPVKTGDLDDLTIKNVTLRKHLENMATACVEEYKKRNETKTLIFHKFLRANWRSSGRPKFYITFNAKESPHAPDVEYQAKAAWCAGTIYPILCRPSATPQKGDEEIN